MTDHAEYDASLGAEYRRMFPPQSCRIFIREGEEAVCCIFDDDHAGRHSFELEGLDEFAPDTSHNPEPTP